MEWDLKSQLIQCNTWPSTCTNNEHLKIWNEYLILCYFYSILPLAIINYLYLDPQFLNLVKQSRSKLSMYFVIGIMSIRIN